MEQYQLPVFSFCIIIALIWSWVSNSKLRYKLWKANQDANYQDQRIKEMQEDYDELLTDNSRLIEALSKKNGL